MREPNSNGLGSEGLQPKSDDLQQCKIVISSPLGCLQRLLRLKSLFVWRAVSGKPHVTTEPARNTTTSEPCFSGQNLLLRFGCLVVRGRFPGSWVFLAPGF